MPVPSQIAHAAASFRQTAALFEKSMAGLTDEEWTRRPNETSNAMIWVAGHIVWSRSRALAYLGTEWSKPWLPLFARGSRAADQGEYPSPEELQVAWQEVKATLSTTMENMSEEALSGPGPERAPSFDGKLSGLVSFLAFHESYHVGQACYLRRWLGHGQVAG